MFERFTWELRAKLLSAHQTVRFAQSSRALGTRLRLDCLAHLAHLASLVYHAASATHTRPEPAPPRRRPARVADPSPPHRVADPSLPHRVADPSPPQAPVSTTVCPNRRPHRLKHPKNAHFHRSGLHFEHAPYN